MTITNPLSARIRKSDVPVRFFFDESLLGVGKAIAMVRPDSVYAGHPRCQIISGNLDVEWLPIVASEDWIVILRDKRIRTRPTEHQLIARLKLRFFIMTGSNRLNSWDQLKILVRYWDKMEKIIQSRPVGPWIYRINKSGIYKANLALRISGGSDRCMGGG